MKKKPFLFVPCVGLDTVVVAIHGHFHIFLGTGFEGYGWTNVSDSVPINYICEILQSETSQMDMIKREEGKIIFRISYHYHDRTETVQ